MSDTNWHDIAEAIRERRLDDIPAETWELIADKIENRKRGKGRPPDPLIEAPFGDGYLKLNDRILACGMTHDERTKWIGKRYEELREQGVKSIEAQCQIANELNCSFKIVEAAITEHRRYRKIEAENNALMKKTLDEMSEFKAKHYDKNLSVWKFNVNGGCIVIPCEIVNECLCLDNSAKLFFKFLFAVKNNTSQETAFYDALQESGVLKHSITPK